MMLFSGSCSFVSLGCAKLNFGVGGGEQWRSSAAAGTLFSASNAEIPQSYPDYAVFPPYVLKIDLWLQVDFSLQVQRKS